MMKQALKPIAFDALEDHFGEPVADALRQAIGPEMDSEHSVLAWGGAQAKDHLSELMTRTLSGQCQVVRRRSDEPVLMMSIAHLGKFVGEVAPAERWADWIAQEPEDALDVGVGMFVANVPVRGMIGGGAEAGAPTPWGVAQAKGHFKELLDRVLDGESQFLRRPPQEVVLLTCASALAHLLERAPKPRFADFIAYDRTLPTGAPLEISEAGFGTDAVDF